MDRITTAALGGAMMIAAGLGAPLAAQETVAQETVAQETVAQEVVAVELFTSQGCAACPPADALLGALSVRDDVVALGLHVDYWNYLGWSDTLGASANTRRQRDYAAALGERMVYTPQMVIDGAAALVGSRREAVLAAIAQAGAAPRPVALEIAREGDRIRIAARRTAPDAPERGALQAVDIVYFIYDRPETIAIARGENAGREITYVNPVRAWMPLERWQGATGAWSVPAPEGARGVAVVAQAAADGRVLAAAKYEFQRGAAAAAFSGVAYTGAVSDD